MTIGITGGIGSGKSTIARELAKRGFVIYDCDREAKRIIAEDQEVQQAIINLLGEEAFLTSHNNNGLTSRIYNTAYVAQKVFAHKELLAQLNAIVHPAVKKDILSLIHSFTHSLTPLFLESAILYEAGFDALCDKIIVVEAPEEIRIARTIARDYDGDASPVNINKVRARIHAQVPHKGDLTIINDGTTALADLTNEIENWLKK